jgi:hypothetical protein
MSVKTPKERAPIIREAFGSHGAICRSLEPKADVDIQAAAKTLSMLMQIRQYTREIRLTESDVQAMIDGFMEGGRYDEEEMPMGGHRIIRKKVEAAS